MPVLEIRDLHKSFSGNKILKGVDLSVEKGEVITVLGPSGSGKTTMLRCINFLERAEKGEIVFNGTRLNVQNASKRDIAQVRKQSAFVFQNYNLFNNKTALQNVTEGLVVGRGVSKAEAAERGKAALAKVGLSNRLDYYPSQLSGGQQQRVGIARAIAVNPEIILFDEPTSALDPELIGEVLKVMRELAKEEVTMVVVTHELSFARDAATRAVFMDEGVIMEEGTPDEMFDHPQEKRLKMFLKRLNTVYTDGEGI
jgi:L-cystine transport system ATP-binding protein